MEGAAELVLRLEIGRCAGVCVCVVMWYGRVERSLLIGVLICGRYICGFVTSGAGCILAVCDVTGRAIGSGAKPGGVSAGPETGLWRVR